MMVLIICLPYSGTFKYLVPIDSTVWARVRKCGLVGKSV